MPRAHRNFLPGHVWHITQRCHQKAFLLRFAKDRECWCYWLYQAKKRYGLCVLNYIVTANHVHLLVQAGSQPDTSIARGLQLIAGRTAQAYNRRKNRQGAFWEDRYHATAIDSDTHLARCLVYIDLNMVRAGVVTHPRQWPHSGYHEIQQPGTRYRLIDMPALQDLLGVQRHANLRTLHAQWIEQALATKRVQREGVWSESLAVGGRSFVEQLRRQLGAQAYGRQVRDDANDFVLKEDQGHYRPTLGG